MNLIDLGNQIRKESKNKGVLAVAAAAAIFVERPEPDPKTQLIRKTAYIANLT